MAKLLKPEQDSSLIQQGFNGRSTTILDKVSKLFSPTEWVDVINPDTEAFVWQYLPPEKEQISFDSSSTTVPHRIMHRDDPEVYKLEPGQSATLMGGNAYVMLDGLVKRMMAKRTISRNPNVPPGQARNFNFSDDMAQEQWINEIYLGKANPYDAAIPQEDTPIALDEAFVSQIDNDLGLTDASLQEALQPVKHPGGRPRKTAA